MTIEEMIMSGAYEEEVLDALIELKAAKAARDEAEAQKKQEQEQEQDEDEKAAHKEDLKREARANIINGVIAYAEAFDLLPEDWTLDEDDTIKMFEETLIKLEALIPLYLQMRQVMDEDVADEMIKKMFGDMFDAK